VLHFGGVPPEEGLRHCLVRRQRLLKAARIRDDVNEFGKNLGGEGKGNFGLKNLALQQIVSGFVRGQLDKFEFGTFT
jgi:hypothetical protein